MFIGYFGIYLLSTYYAPLTVETNMVPVFMGLAIQGNTDK